MVPPVTESGHARPHLRFGTWLGIYEIHTPGMIGGDNGSMRMDLDNMPQPRLPNGCRALAVLHQGLASTEHAEFVAQLERQRRPSAT
jgi:hypothetical protein